MKPLYYVAQRRSLVFASEIKALTCWSGLSAEVDLAAVSQYLRLRYVPGPGGMLRGVRKLAAGHQLVFANGERAASRAGGRRPARRWPSRGWAGRMRPRWWAMRCALP